MIVWPAWGQSPVAAALLAALGLAIDGLALILRCAPRRSCRAAGTRLPVWSGAVTGTLIAAAGFAAGNFGDAVTARGAKIAERAELTARIETFKERHAQAVAAAERARAAECVSVGPPVCRRRETALAAVLADPETELKAAVAAQVALPAVASADPAGEMIAVLSDGVVTATAVHRARIAG